MARPRNKSKAGVTLIEVLLAGAMVSIVVLSMLEGFTTAARICHENAEVLRADNIAFDLLWRKFHRHYKKELSKTEDKAEPPFIGTHTPAQKTSDNTSPYREKAKTFRDYPTYPDQNRQVAYQYREIIGKEINIWQQESSQNAEEQGGKWLSVHLQYGPSYSRMHNLSVFRCSIPRPNSDSE